MPHKHQKNSNSDTNDPNNLSLSGSAGKGQIPDDTPRRNIPNDNISPKAKNSPKDIALLKICGKYGIQPDTIDHLQKLNKFEIVMVIDDSGSMETEIAGTQRTRWDEAGKIAKIVLEIGVIFDSNGVDVHFLNREPILKVKDPKVIDQQLKISPDGYTPLVRVLKKIFESPLARRGRDKKLLVFVITDGDPTDDEGNEQIDQFEHLMKEIRDSQTTYVSFLLCTDDHDAVKCFAEWDKAIQHVDVTDDFETEKENVRRCCGNNHRFTYGDYVVKALVGSVIQDIDIQNEQH